MRSNALRVVRDKVVPELQALCVAYLESDLRGREQLESSVNGIVARLSLPGADAAAIAQASTNSSGALPVLSPLPKQVPLITPHPFRRAAKQFAVIKPVSL